MHLIYSMILIKYANFALLKSCRNMISAFNKASYLCTKIQYQACDHLKYIDTHEIKPVPI